MSMNEATLMNAVSGVLTTVTNLTYTGCHPVTVVGYPTDHIFMSNDGKAARHFVNCQIIGVPGMEGKIWELDIISGGDGDIADGLFSEIPVKAKK